MSLIIKPSLTCTGLCLSVDNALRLVTVMLMSTLKKRILLSLQPPRPVCLPRGITASCSCRPWAECRSSKLQPPAGLLKPSPSPDVTRVTTGAAYKPSPQNGRNLQPARLTSCLLEGDAGPRCPPGGHPGERKTWHAWLGQLWDPLMELEREQM